MQKITRRLFASWVFLVLSFPLCAAPLNKNAVASAHPLATEAGIAVLEQGGNAFDAAVTVASVLAVVEPYSSGMGGGGFWLLHRASDNKTVFVDARETAPLAAKEDLYIRNGKADPNLSTNGALAAAIPGQPAALVHVANKYGRLPLSKSLAKSIELAEQGFPADSALRSMTTLRAPILTSFASSTEIFLPNNTVPAEGALIKQTDLAKTLRQIAQQGNAGFYQGKMAQTLVDEVKKAGGIWSLEDLKRYQVVEREPIKFQFENATFFTAPPPSSGGIALAEMFNMLNFLHWRDYSKLDQEVLLIEVMRRAYRDRAEYLGDPDFVNIPSEKLLDVNYAKQLANNISVSRATPSASLPPAVSVKQGTHTTHFSVLDKDGNRVSATLSINLPFGSAFVVPGTGVLLNDEMDDFSAQPGAPNAYGLVGNAANKIEPGKRPLSSMTPTFIETANETAIIGTPGGSRIISMVFLGSIEFLKRQPVEQWVARPRFHQQYLPDVVEYENAAFSNEELSVLKTRGYSLQPTGRNYGNMQVILQSEKSVNAASDPRGIGYARVK